MLVGPTQSLDMPGHPVGYVPPTLNDATSMYEWSVLEAFAGRSPFCEAFDGRSSGEEFSPPPGDTQPSGVESLPLFPSPNKFVNAYIEGFLYCRCE